MPPSPDSAVMPPLIPAHNANDPVRSLDVQRRWIGWIEQYFNEVTTTSR
jgi:hypothetical protein